MVFCTVATQTPLRERLASLSQRFAMPKPVQQFESKDPIEELTRLGRLIMKKALDLAFSERSIMNRIASNAYFSSRRARNLPSRELNRWIADPILRNEVMARVMRSDNLTVEFDEEGIPIKVIKIRAKEKN